MKDAEGFLVYDQVAGCMNDREYILSVEGSLSFKIDTKKNVRTYMYVTVGDGL